MINEIEKLKNFREKELADVRQHQVKLQEIQDNYARLRSKLIELPNETEYDVFVPIAYSSGDNFEFTTGGLKSNSRGINREMLLAFMEGKLVHTNEILVHLGGDWFTQRSAKQSAEIAERKLKQCKQRLNDLEKSEQLISDWLAKIDELKGDQQQLVEIHENYNEQEEQEWRKKHRENVRKHKQKERLDREIAAQNERSQSLAPFTNSSSISEHVVERVPVNEMFKLNIGETSGQSVEPAKPLSKFKQQMLNKKK